MFVWTWCRTEPTTYETKLLLSLFLLTWPLQSVLRPETSRWLSCTYTVPEDAWLLLVTEKCNNNKIQKMSKQTWWGLKKKTLFYYIENLKLKLNSPVFDRITANLLPPRWLPGENDKVNTQVKIFMEHLIWIKYNEADLDQKKKKLTEQFRPSGEEGEIIFTAENMGWVFLLTISVGRIFETLSGWSLQENKMQSSVWSCI